MPLFDIWCSSFEPTKLGYIWYEGIEVIKMIDKIKFTKYFSTVNYFKMMKLVVKHVN